MRVHARYGGSAGLEALDWRSYVLQGKYFNF